MNDLAEAMEKCKPICELRDQLIEAMKAEIATKGLGCISTEESGEVVDMIKDLAEAHEKCMEALYYQKVVETMTSYEEPRYGEQAGNYGYNSNRYKSSGRFAPSGQGSRMGYGQPEMWDEMPYMNNGMMGYDGGHGRGQGSGQSSMGRGGSNSSSGTSNGGSMGYMHEDGMDDRFGRTYNDYKRMRKYYHETSSPDAKNEMDMKAEEHVQQSVLTIRDIWKDADPNLKKRMKEDITKLLNDMPT